MPGLFKVTKLILAFSIILLTIACLPSCQQNADAEITGEDTISTKKTKTPKNTAWILLGSGLTLVVTGAIYYAKGAVYGLTEDCDGSPVIIKNRILTAGKIMVITGIAGIIACIVLFYKS